MRSLTKFSSSMSVTLPETVSVPALRTTGVDIGSRTIKGVRLKSKKKKVYVDKFFFHDLSKTSKDYPYSVEAVEPLKAMIEINKLHNSLASTSLRDDEILNFAFNLPELGKKEFSAAVHHEIQSYLDVPIDMMSYDFRSKRIEPDPQGNTINVKAFCAKRDLIENKISLLEGSQLKPAAVETELLAIVAMLDFNQYVEKGKNYVVVDLGENHVSTGLIIDGELQFSKIGNIGSGNVNKSLMSRLDFGYEAAEKEKIKYNFSNESGTPVAKIIDDAYFDLFKEVKSAKEAVEFYLEHFGSGAQIDEILLVGGGSQIKNIDEVMEMFFKIPATVVNPFRNIEIFEDAKSSKNEGIAVLGPYMAVAVGLALRGV